MKVKKLTEDLYEDLAKARKGELDIKSLKEFTNATGKIITGNINIHKYNMDMKYEKKTDFFED